MNVVHEPGIKELVFGDVLMDLGRRKFVGFASAALVGAVGLFWFSFDREALAGRVFTGATPGIAINGYDTVAYLTVGKPVRGSIDHVEHWKGIAWRFASEENRGLFAAAPEKYAPQYGGFCAYAVAHGSKTSTEPDAFSVIDNKLYLNFDQAIKSRWHRNRSVYIKDGDSNWRHLQQ